MSSRMLVVDDNALSRDLLLRTLRKLGVVAEEAAGGAEALARIGEARREGRPFDITFLDLSMPGLDGWETARLVRETGEFPVLIAVSGADERADWARTGFDAFIQKPVPLDRLPGIIGRFAGLAEERRGKAGPLFRFCPGCGGRNLRFESGRRWTCPDCGFGYYHNVATAAGIVVGTDRGVLLLERAREPRRGTLALPGGFVDPGEGAEEAARRECREETGWSPDGLEFLASFPNRYIYEGIGYATCDLFFSASAPGLDGAALSLDPGESSGFLFTGAAGFPWERLAFDSTRRALDLFFSRAGT